MAKIERILLFAGMIGAIYFSLRNEILINTRWIFEVIIILLFSLLCISLHRFTQNFFSSRAGDINQRIEGNLTLNPVKFIDILGLIPFIFFRFGWAKPIKSEIVLNGKATLQRTGIILSGIVLNLLLGFISALFVGPAENISLTLAAVLKLFSEINIYFVLFSLLPIPPLDGWLIFMSLLKRRANIYYFEFYGELIIIILLGSNILPKFITYLGDYLFMVLNI